MARRIRSLKPELLDDEKTANLSDTAFRVWVACVLTADDFGTFRADPRLIEKTVYWAAIPERDVPTALSELGASGMVSFYRARGQRYGRFANWTKHQRVDNAGKGGVLPGPEQADAETPEPPHENTKKGSSASTSPPRGETGEPPPRLAEIRGGNNSSLGETIDLSRRDHQPSAATRGGSPLEGKGSDRKGAEEGARARDGTAAAEDGPDERAKTILARISGHSGLSAAATPEMASALGRRFATLEVQSIGAVKFEWLLNSIDECASDVAGLGLNAETIAKKLRTYCDATKSPKSGVHPAGQTGEEIAIRRSNRVQEEITMGKLGNR